MRRNKAEICLLRQLASKPRFPNVSNRGYWKRSSDSHRVWRRSTQLWLGDKQTRKAEPYILPRLILDLDAHDSPYVKKLEDLTPEETINIIKGSNRTSKSEHASNVRSIGYPREVEQNRGSTGKAGIATQMGNHAPAKKAADTLNSFRMTISPIDLLLYAFRGYPTDLRKEKRFQFPNISRLLDAHNVTPIDNAGVGIRSLIYDFGKDGEKSLKISQFTTEREHTISLALSTCRDWYSFRKSVFMLASTVAGRKYLSRRGGIVVQYLKQNVRKDLLSGSSTHISLEEALRFINHVTVNMMSNGANIGYRLCNAGIFFSAECASLPALKKYLQIAVDNNYKTDSRTRAGLRSICRAITSPADLQPRRQHLEDNFEENQKFLTGWKTDYGAKSGDEKQNCFADFFSKPYFNDMESFYLYYNYILGLATIGWKESLHREFLRLESYNLRMFSASMKGLLFATAYVIAKDSSKALTFLEKCPSPLDRGGSITNDDMINTRDDDLTNDQNLGSDTASGEQEPVIAKLHQDHPPKAMINIMLPIFYKLHGAPLENSLMKELPAVFPQEPKEALAIIEKLFNIDSIGASSPLAPPEAAQSIDEEIK